MTLASSAALASLATAATDQPPGLHLAMLPTLAAIVATGADAAAFLHNQLSSDVKVLANGHGQYSSYNSPKGRMLATLIVWRDADTYRLVVAADLADAMRKRLAMFVMRSKVVLATDATPLAGLYGAGAAAALATLANGRPAGWASVRVGSLKLLALPDGRYLVDGATDVAEPALAAAVGDAATWDWLGIRAGVPWVTAATSDQLIAQSANWELVGGVDFRKGCYPGQEIVARMQYLGKLKERLHVFHADVDGVTIGTPVRSLASEEAAGIVVNAAPAPGGGTDLLAVVKHAALAAGPVALADATVLTALPMPYAVPTIENVRVRL